jgi:hypothetical protein
MHAHPPLWTHVRKPYPYELFRRLCRQILKIDALSMETSPTTESTTPLNPEKFALMESRTQDLRSYWGFYN